MKCLCANKNKCHKQRSSIGGLREITEISIVWRLGPSPEKFICYLLTIVINVVDLQPKDYIRLVIITVSVVR